ncbi:MAG: LysR family transcriptional regulator [Pseudomonadota bacterium]
MNSNRNDFSDAELSLLFEKIRSFVTLAQTLNLSRTVAELGSTRQTVRRHISQLEELKGKSLFRLDNRQYQLTQAGRDALPEAIDLIARGRSWLAGQVSHRNQMQFIKVNLPENRTFWLQQRPLGEIWTSHRPLLRTAFQAWSHACGQLEAPEMKHIRPYVMVYRQSPAGWLCVEIGDDSSYVSWSGWAAARSSIGRSMTVLPGGDEFAHIMAGPFEDAAIHQNSRLDHVFTQLQREPGGHYFSICYQRLLLSGRFPDGSLALISIVDRHHDIEIDGLSPDDMKEMPDDCVMPAELELKN